MLDIQLKVLGFMIDKIKSESNHPENFDQHPRDQQLEVFHVFLIHFEDQFQKEEVFQHFFTFNPFFFIR